MTDEVWKDILGFDGYQISNLGRVRSCRKGSRKGVREGAWRIVAPRLGRSGHYLMVQLYDKQQKQRVFTLHRLLYSVFVSPIPAGMVVDHIDRNKLNNSLDNLRLATVSQNVANRTPRVDRKYRGVHLKRSGRFSVETSNTEGAVYLGTFDTEIEAAKAYNDYALKAFGQFAVLNDIPGESN